MPFHYTSLYKRELHCLDHFNWIVHSVVGAVLIVLGLYLVLWGKGKEALKKMKAQHQHSTDNDIATVHADHSIIKSKNQLQEHDNQATNKQNQERHNVV